MIHIHFQDVILLFDVRSCHLQRIQPLCELVESLYGLQIVPVGVRRETPAAQKDAFDVLKAIEGIEDPLGL